MLTHSVRGLDPNMRNARQFIYNTLPPTKKPPGFVQQASSAVKVKLPGEQGTGLREGSAPPHVLRKGQPGTKAGRTEDEAKGMASRCAVLGGLRVVELQRTRQAQEPETGYSKTTRPLPLPPSRSDGGALGPAAHHLVMCCEARGAPC